MRKLAFWFLLLSLYLLFLAGSHDGEWKATWRCCLMRRRIFGSETSVLLLCEYWLEVLWNVVSCFLTRTCDLEVFHWCCADGNLSGSSPSMYKPPYPPTSKRNVARFGKHTIQKTTLGAQSYHQLFRASFSTKPAAKRRRGNRVPRTLCKIPL